MLRVFATISAERLRAKLHILRDSYTEGSLPIDDTLAEITAEELEDEHSGKPFAQQIEWIRHSRPKHAASLHRLPPSICARGAWLQDGDLVQKSQYF